MGKYRISESSGNVAGPSVELVPGKEGVIKYTGMFNWATLLYNGKDPGILCGNTARPARLSEMSMSHVGILSRVHGIPLDELEEIRNLERQYRSRKPATPVD